LHVGERRGAEHGADAALERARGGVGEGRALLAHLQGPIAAALMARADELLAEPPRIDPVDLLAVKLP
jgi:hypothetical protein